MIIQNKNDLKAETRADGVSMTNFFGYDIKAGEKVTMGHAVFPPGTDVPPASHDADEYSYILSGEVKCECGGVVNTMSAGSAGFIGAGEVHRSFNDSDKPCTLIWMLVEK